MLIPDGELPAGWREGLAEIARRTHRVFRDHPSIIEHMGEDDAASLGPGFLRHIEQTLEVSSRTGLGLGDQLALSSLVDDYVFGYDMRVGRGLAAGGGAEAHRRRMESMADYLAEQLESGEYQHLAALAGEDPRGGLARLAGMQHGDDDERFEWGLRVVLDGIEGWIAQRPGAGSRGSGG